MKMKITASVVNVPARTAKVKIASNVAIRLDGKLIASREFGGNISPDAAVKEFKKAPATFKPQGELTTADLSLYAAAA